MAFATPILFIVFNRPNHTRKVLERIREIKPNFLFVAADGPRRSHVGDADKCNEVREVINRGIDWPCQVKTQYRDENLGCGKGPAQAITWFFDHVEEGIILEDDCLPSHSFFDFSRTLLAFYKDDLRIMHISGNNFQNGIARGKSAYYFSAYTHNWGWATWRNRWALFDFDMNGFSEEFVLDASKFYGFGAEEILFWQKSLRDVVVNKRIDIWDFRWMYSVWKNNGISVLPQVNLVKNIGFDSQGTHTKVANADIQALTVGDLHMITHPSEIEVHALADRYSYQKHFNPKDFILLRIIKAIRSKTGAILSSVLFPIRSRLLYNQFTHFTMIPKANYIANLSLCWKFKDVQGDIVECGTWKGGMIAGIVSMMGTDRSYHLFDSFEGLPEVKEIDGPDAQIWQSNTNGIDYFDNCKADINDARTAMIRSGAKQYTINKGWFNETLKTFSFPEGIAILRLDADWYDSTMDCLVNLFPRINKGGILILDDYYTWEGCSKAIHDYLSTHKLPYRIHSVHGICYLIKQ